MLKRNGISGWLFAQAMVLLLVWPATAFCAAEADQVLEAARQNVAAELSRLDEGLREAAAELGKTGLAGESARPVLAALCGKFDYAVDCAAVNLQGRMATIEPEAFRRFEGKDISGQKQVRRILKTGRAVLSSVFVSVEGFPAVDAQYPVKTPKGQRIGSVSVLFQPEKFLGSVFVPLARQTPFGIWAMEKGGLILYDADASQIGLNLFTSGRYQSYAGLLALGKRIAARPQGKGAYEFTDGRSTRVVRKNALWKTASLYGMSWRLVAVTVDEPAGKAKQGIRPSSAKAVSSGAPRQSVLPG